jgi:hypothetical protein
MAKEKIYIHDWWLSPELYLRRPAADNGKYLLVSQTSPLTPSCREMEARSFVEEESGRGSPHLRYHLPGGQQ